MVSLSGYRDSQEVFHGSPRGETLAAEPRMWLGLGHKQEPHQAPFLPTRDAIRGEAPPAWSTDVTFSVPDVLHL